MCHPLYLLRKGLQQVQVSFISTPLTPVCLLETRAIKEQNNKLFINQGKGRIGRLRKKKGKSR